MSGDGSIAQTSEQGRRWRAFHSIRESRWPALIAEAIVKGVTENPATFEDLATRNNAVGKKTTPASTPAFWPFVFKGEPFFGQDPDGPCSSGTCINTELQKGLITSQIVSSSCSRSTERCPGWSCRFS